MEIRLEGTGGPEGWPAPGCGCASCGRLSPGRRGPASIVIDGIVRLPPRAGDPAHGGVPPGGRLLVRTLDGYEITGPDGSRVLYTPCCDGLQDDEDDEDVSGPRPREPFDLVLIDPLDRPERLGDLRRRGRVTPTTRVIAVHLDHRVPSEDELARRLAHWRAEAVPDGTVLDTRDIPARHPLGDPPPPGPARRTLLLGGARSGKSEEAELRVAADPDVTYVATGPAPGDDPSWLARVKLHRDRRPRHWRTLETTDLTGVLTGTDSPGRTLLIDGIGTWLAAVFDECGAWPGGDSGGDSEQAPADVRRRCDALVAAWRHTRARVVAVSDEVGLGVIPATAAGRLFRDELGRLNQRLARESEDVALVIAGRTLPLPC
ncbi:bifunctional adenosylcobinamide kinase/adenosylcobinamide-phosphate guanylyltransferase [Sphaerimonospora sp. CA-214678]|uniref:bifunctional adenosylcobinamide kinase/adenosylcobinamide-phosphate guanylyltransferase n=1 Tax=Sphaerimonospora sp. CA-214678 TaxID=3240029 RepID=UPI003D8C118C